MNKIVFITGASSGIGEALAYKYSSKGYKVALFSRRKKLLDIIKAKIEENGGEALSVPGDVRDIKSIENAFEKVKEKWDLPDLVIANAGVSYWIKASDMTMEQVHETIDVNLKGLINTVQTVLPYMIKRKRGHIVGISSSSAYRGIPNLAVYSATKSALVKYLEAIRVENKDNGISVTTILPGFIKTPMLTNLHIPNWVPKPFLLTVEETCERVSRAIEKRKSHLVFPMPINLLSKISVVIPNLLYDNIVFPFARWWYRK